ncbi:MAG: hypothetical protein WCK15_24340, partial [Pirellula sp.]
VEVKLLRPLAWLEQAGAITEGVFDVNVQELDIEGKAAVLQIHPCPPIQGGEGQVVTGTFRHTSDSLVELQIEGEPQPIICTSGHLIWSEDRREFVRAAELRMGEGLRLALRKSRLESLTRICSERVVCNIEVMQTHVYMVGAQGTLVHNAGANCDNDPGPPEDGVAWKNGWRTADGKFASPQGTVRSGAIAESSVWDAVEAKPGWQVIRGEVSVRDAAGQLRKYDGAAISPGGRTIVLEVKSGTATRTPAQRSFDQALNASGVNTLPTVGQNAGQQVQRTILIRRP